MNKKLTTKIIDYLVKIEEKSKNFQKINKKESLLLFDKIEYDKLDQAHKVCLENFSKIKEEKRGLLSSEIKNLEIKKRNIIDKIKKRIIAEEGIKQNAVMEIRPGIGGVEAGLFVD